MSSRVKILVSYHEKNKFVKNDSIIPIQTGRAIADEKFEEAIGDDTGDNISSENGKYCELTSQYWAWKNQDKLDNPEYIGCMHYRRHFIFDNELKRTEERLDGKSFFYKVPYFTEEYLNNLDKKYIEEALDGVDIVLPKKFDFEYHKIKSIRENYGSQIGQNIDNYDLLMLIVKKLYPDYSKEVEEFKKLKSMYICNLFIMKKELFNEYNEFCFTILKEMDKLINSEHLSDNGLRFLGYMGEFLLNIFLMKKINTTDIKTRELDVAVFENMEYQEYVEPVFKDNFTTIVVPCSNLYLPYLSVWLQSMIDHSSKNHNYDIVVLEDNITITNKQKISTMIEDRKNFSMRFFNPKRYIDVSKIEIQKKYLNAVSSYRITLNKFMKNYHSVVIAEVDMIFNHDIKDLGAIDITNHPIAATIDAFNIKNYNVMDWLADFVAHDLKMTDPYRYTNTGVMLLNIDEFNDKNYSDQLIDMMRHNKYSCLEQDAMNGLFDQDIYILDPRWNFLVCNEYDENIKKYMPCNLYNTWKETEKDPFIIHWCGKRKPWQKPEEYLAYKWWDIARRTPYYEEILKQNLGAPQALAKPVPKPAAKPAAKPAKPVAPTNYALIVSIVQEKKLLQKYIKYRILQNFVFGKKREEYRNKKNRYKNRYYSVKDFIRRYKNAY